MVKKDFESGVRESDPCQYKADIVLADDDPVLLSILFEGLSGVGYRVRQATLGKAALALCKELPPDLAILDISMPDLNGIEVARILSHDMAVPVLFLSGHGEEIIVEEAMTNSGEITVGYVLKPVNIDTFIPQVQAALELSRQLKAMKSNEIRLHNSLDNNREIFLATGIMMERFQLGADEAYETLRHIARSERRKMVAVASEIVQASERLKAPTRLHRSAKEKEGRGAGGR
jgi:response regulator NasT